MEGGRDSGHSTQDGRSTRYVRWNWLTIDHSVWRILADLSDNNWPLLSGELVYHPLGHRHHVLVHEPDKHKNPHKWCAPHTTLHPAPQVSSRWRHDTPAFHEFPGRRSFKRRCWRRRSPSARPSLRSSRGSRAPRGRTVNALEVPGVPAKTVGGGRWWWVAKEASELGAIQKMRHKQVTKGSPLGDTLSLSCEASVGTSGSNN